MTDKRGYFVHNGDDDQPGLAVVAQTVKEAKKIAYNSGEIIYGDTGWSSLCARWVQDADVAALPIGVIHDTRVALLCGIYERVAEYPCDECKKDGDVCAYSGRVLCEDCLEKAYAIEDGGGS